MKKVLTLVSLAVLLTGCLSAFHRVDTDKYEGASATWTGNGRTTTMATSQPVSCTPSSSSAASTTAAPAPCPVIKQVAPGVGELFIVRIGGKQYEAMKKTDGKVYILREIK